MVLEIRVLGKYLNTSGSNSSMIIVWCTRVGSETTWARSTSTAIDINSHPHKQPPTTTVIHNNSHPHQQPPTSTATHNYTHPQQKPPTTTATHITPTHPQQRPPTLSPVLPPVPGGAGAASWTSGSCGRGPILS